MQSEQRDEIDRVAADLLGDEQSVGAGQRVCRQLVDLLVGQGQAQVADPGAQCLEG